MKGRRLVQGTMATTIGTVMSWALACVAVGSLVRVAEFAVNTDVEKAKIKEHARAITSYTIVTAVVLSVAGTVYWIVAKLFYKAPDVPELVPATAATPAGETASTALGGILAVTPAVSELRTMMMNKVTPKASPPMVQVLPHRIRKG